MTSESICWRAESPCPLTQISSSRQFSCQTWFHCERAGDYVIRWRCPTLEEESLNFTSTALLLCKNQSDAWLLTQCPPHVVCTDDSYKSNSRTRNGPTSTEIAIIVALAAFAFFALVLIAVSSYKYWAMRKRYKSQKRLPVRHHPRHFLSHECPFPMSYHNLWGPGLQQTPYKRPQSGHTSKQHGSSQSDVYFSRPPESWRYFEHLLTTSDDSTGNNNNYIARHGGRAAPVPGIGERLKVDPSVATESFVYHHPMRVGNLHDVNRGTEDWFYQNKLVNNESEDRENSAECYHIYKGHLSSFRAHKQTQRNFTNSRNEYRQIAKTNSEFARGDNVSSIPIAGFSVHDLRETSIYRDCMDFDLQLMDDSSGRGFTSRQCDSDSSHESRSQVATSAATHSRNSQPSNITSAEMQRNNRLRQNVNASSGKAHVASSRTSPDVINSHNFTNRFVRVGKNIYRPVLTKSPSSSSLTLSNAKNNYLDVSYDSFLNEHIKELAHRGGASSSTFEAGHNQQTEVTNCRPSIHRY